MKLGDRGAAVMQLQQQLNRAGARLYPDGIFGPSTEAAVRDFQQRAGLVVDGIAGPKTLSVLTHGDDSRLLRQCDIEAAAERLGVSVAAIMAVNEVESRGAGFLASGRPVILFERHTFHNRLRIAGFDVAALSDAQPLIVNARAGGYIGGEAEYQRLAAARSIAEVIALESASWGAFQVMGYHWQRLGYTCAHEFVELQSRSEADQLDGFVRFVLADPELHKALKARQWAKFARLYNGPEYARNLYDTKLARAFARYAAAHTQEVA